MNQHPQIFEQLENQRVTSKSKLILVLQLTQRSDIVDQYICPHTVQYIQKELEIDSNKPQCNCINTQEMKNSFFESILLFLFTILEDDKELEYYKREEQKYKNISQNPQIIIYFKIEKFEIDIFEQFKRNLREYEVFEDQKNQDALNLIQLVNFANDNNFKNQISFSIIKFHNCYLKLVNLFNGQITSNSFDQILPGYIKLLEFFQKASNNNVINLKPVCIHTVNLGQLNQIEQIEGKNFQDLQTQQKQCLEQSENNEICEKLQICQSFGLLLDDILEKNRDKVVTYQDLVNKIVQGKINSLKLIIQFLDPKYIDNVDLIDLNNEDYRPIDKKTIKNIDTHLEIEIKLYKIYFIRKTLYILANLVVESLETDEVYKYILQLFNYVEDIYYLNSKNFLEDYKNSQYMKLFQNQYEQMQQEEENYKNLPRVQEVQIYQQQLQQLNNYRVQFEKILKQLQFEQLQFRIICCLHSDFFFSKQNIIQNMTIYLNDTNYQKGIQFEGFEQFLEDSNKIVQINQMYQYIYDEIEEIINQQQQQQQR